MAWVLLQGVQVCLAVHATWHRLGQEGRDAPRSPGIEPDRIDDGLAPESGNQGVPQPRLFDPRTENGKREEGKGKRPHADQLPPAMPLGHLDKPRTLFHPSI